jgi:sulfatase maturation enzyme AslB (radical SAM superfamily)
MNEKDYLTNKNFCPVPWTGFMYNFDGSVKNCIRNQTPIGSLKDNSITEILQGDVNLTTKHNMTVNKPGPTCNVCYDLEKDTKGFDVISDRIFYLKELKDISLNTYKSVDAFNLSTIDIRWNNTCNFACVYCGPEFSSKWATELKIEFDSVPQHRFDQMKQYIFDRGNQLKHVYMAGGEPLLMKENLELLRLLKEKNPTVNLRINTNLSKVDTQVFDLICEFKNVHWIVSVETIEAEYEYIRWGGQWKDFLDNLTTISKLNHKISFNMLHFLLNYRSIFDCINYLKNLGFHNNSFIVGALLTPEHLNIRHLPNTMLQSVERELEDWINQKPGFLLENGLRNMLQYIKDPVEKNIEYCLAEIAKMDQRRNVNSRAVFTELYNLIERQ